MYEIENYKKNYKAPLPKSLFFERINRFDKPLGRLIEDTEEGTNQQHQTCKGHTTADPPPKAIAWPTACSLQSSSIQLSQHLTEGDTVAKPRLWLQDGKLRLGKQKRHTKVPQ